MNAANLTDDKSTLVQVMAWCRQATSHYLSQCWPRSMSPNGVTRPQWVKCNTMWSCYNVVQYNMTLHMTLQWLGQNINKRLTDFLLDKMAANFADDILKCISMNEKFCVSIQISLKFVPTGPIDNRLVLVQVMASHWPSSLMHIRSTRGGWVKTHKIPPLCASYELSIVRIWEKIKAHVMMAPQCVQ